MSAMGAYSVLFLDTNQYQNMLDAIDEVKKGIWLEELLQNMEYPRLH